MNLQIVASAGELVALCCPQYNERPQIGLVLKVASNKLHVRWYDGSWTGKWKIYKYFLGRKEMTWEEEVDITHLVLRDVQLTSAGRLSLKTKRKLKELYKC